MRTPVEELITRCQQHRKAGAKEAKIREEFVSHLRRVFPSDPDQKWIDHYVEGAETTLRKEGTGPLKPTKRFVDTLVRSTILEYEPNVEVASVRTHGLSQIKEYAALLIRKGALAQHLRAVLTDFVAWEVFWVESTNTGGAASTTEDHILLHPLEQFDTTLADKSLPDRFKAFIKANLAREESRPVNAEHLVLDLGLKSRVYDTYGPPLVSLTVAARTGRQDVRLATDLWSEFIDRLEGGPGTFRPKSYAAELFLCIVARLLSANVLNGRALRSDDDEILSILDGGFFAKRFRLSNFVEKDYFGWITEPPHAGKVVLVARQIQHDLTAYDFQNLPSGDVFGPLIGQLGEETHRLLLGQQNTPSWLARLLAERCLDRMPAGSLPNFVDMCCGSGAIICEFLKAYLLRHPRASIEVLAQAITGFDIDPLAVALAKTTWVLTLSSRIKGASQAVTIPIFHADSLFTATPTTRKAPRKTVVSDMEVELDGKIVTLPTLLVQPKYRNVFDDAVDWAHDNARRAVELKGLSHITVDLAARRVESSLRDHGVTLESSIKAQAVAGLHQLAVRMAQLAMARRNGIWAFILKNTYRPSLLAGQFNGIISNPPWLALSKIGNNPYKERITDRTDTYGLKPRGPSHPHLEIATTFLLYAADRYLKPNGCVGVLLPGTLLNGDHHEPFRQAAYQSCSRPVFLQLDEVWDVDKNTFKAICVGMVASRKTDAAGVARTSPAGFLCSSGGLTPAVFSVQHLGKRTAWQIGGAATSSSGSLAAHFRLEQGADLMPRSAVAVTIVSGSGKEYQVRTPRKTDGLAYVLGDGKKLKNKQFDGFVAPSFIHQMLQSNTLVPFALDRRLPTIAIPAERDGSGLLQVVDDPKMRADGFGKSADRFGEVEAACKSARIKKPFRLYIDERRKLTKQMFDTTSGFLVLQGAGGAKTAATVFALDDSTGNVVVDQTLYWYWCDEQGEADYYVGMLNSAPVANVIDAFLPKGVFGRRHLHTRPTEVIPLFDGSLAKHARVAVLSGRLRDAIAALVGATPELNDPARWMRAGRKLVRSWLAESPLMTELNALASAIVNRAGKLEKS